MQISLKLILTMLVFAGLQMTSAHAQLFVVESTSPADASVDRHATTNICLSFAFGWSIDETTLDAGDLLVNGVPALSARTVGPFNACFTIPQVSSNQWVVLQVPQGSILREDGEPVQAYEFSYVAAPNPARVIDTSIEQDDLVSGSNITLMVRFDLPMDPVSTSSASIQGGGDPKFPDDVTWSDSNRVFHAQFSQGLMEGEYGLRLESEAWGFRDQSGRELDGEYNGPGIPSGDGQAGGAFRLWFNFDVWNLDVASIIDSYFAARPRGSQHLVYDNLEGFLYDQTDVDRYLLRLDAPQQISISILPQDGQVVEVSFYAPDGQLIQRVHSDDSAGFPQGLLNAMDVPVSGYYALEVSSVTGAGWYNSVMRFNALYEQETLDDTNQNVPADAEDLEPLFRHINGAPYEQVNVVGSLPGSDTFTRTGEDFEAGAAGTNWTFYSEVNGRVQVTNEHAAAEGDFALFMDTDQATTGTLNEAVWEVDLSDYYKPGLAFRWIKYFDPFDLLPLSYTGHAPGDGVSISADGVNWHRATSEAPSFSNLWRSRNLDLFALAQSAGIDLRIPPVYIKFQQYGEASIPGDGYGFDAINLFDHYADWYRFELDPGEYASVHVDGVSAELYREQDGALVYIAAGDGRIRNTSNALVTYFIELTGSRDYTLHVAKQGMLRDAQFNRSVEDARSRAYDITRDGTTYFESGSGLPAFYGLRANAGDRIRLRTQTPGDGPGLLRNDADPAIRLLDNQGQELAQDADGASDGRNAVILYDILTSGQYFVRLDAPGGYVVALTLEGASAEPLPFPVQAIPEVSLHTTEVTLAFGRPIDQSSVDVAGFRLNGVPATGISIGPSSVTYTLPPLMPTNYVMELVAGSVLDPFGTPVAGFESSFVIAPPGLPVVLDTTLHRAGASTLDTNWIVRFSHPMSTWSFGLEDFSIVGPRGEILPADFSFPGNGDRFSIDLPPLLEEGPYTLTLVSGGAAFKSLIGISLDGEHTWPTLPSGDGQEGGDFTATFNLDAVAPMVTTLFTNQAPAGSQVMAFETDGWFQAAGDDDTYLFDLEGGQWMGVHVDYPSNLVVALEVFGPAGLALPFETRQAASGMLAHTFRIEQSGTYRVQVNGSLMHPDAYHLTALINAGTDLNTMNPTNTSVAQARPMPFSQALGLPGSRRSTMQGQFGESEATPRFYRFELLAGERAQLVAENLNSSPISALSVHPPAGAGPIAGSSHPFYDRVVNAFLSATGGWYTVEVAGIGSRFNLMVLRNIEVPHVPYQHPGIYNPLKTEGRVLGQLAADSTLSAPNPALHRFYATDHGPHIFMRTSTPFNREQMVRNSLIPRLEFLDQNMDLLASATANLPDGKNAWIAYTLPPTNNVPLYVSLAPTNETSGAYMLEVKRLHNPVALDIVSDAHVVTPMPGPQRYEVGAAVTCAVLHPSIYYGNLATQLVYSSWSGTGDVPVSGSDTNVSFTLNQASTLTWHWTTNVYFHLATIGNGQIDQASGWQSSALTINATPDPFYAVEWQGVTTGAVTGNLSITLPADRARQVTASFVLERAPLGTPTQWLSQQGHTLLTPAEEELSDRDFDGQAAWEEWLAGTDPNDAASALVADIQPDVDSSRQVIRWNSVAGKTYTIEYKNAVDEPWHVLASAIPATPPVNEYAMFTKLISFRIFKVAVEE